jgi:hypothetical protein
MEGGMNLATALVSASVPFMLVHDVYTTLRAPSGALCCTGDREFGDCEAVEYSLLPDGGVLVKSKRYGATIHVGSGRITWLPVPGSAQPAHWCGRPRYREPRWGNSVQLSDDNPDDDFLTYCAFIDPGGS